MQFTTIFQHLPPELLDQILRHWTAPQSLTAVQYTPESHFYITYACSTDITIRTSRLLPRGLRKEYRRSRKYSWLTAIKHFTSPSDFYFAHYFLFPNTVLPEGNDSWAHLDANKTTNARIARVITRPLSHIVLHGLESIRLDFDAEQYFALFDVSVPPFEYRHTNVVAAREDAARHPDEYLHGAAAFLENTRVLELHFGRAYKWMHPWKAVEGVAWGDSKHRAGVCESGVVIDWVLSFAWSGYYLQHIPSITLTGDIQPWVKTKWHNIFVRHAEFVANFNPSALKADANAFAIHKPDVDAIMNIGRKDEVEWVPEEFYPPQCSCKMSCSRLWGGKLQEVIQDQQWEDVETGSDQVSDWDVGVTVEIREWDLIDY